MLDRLTRVLFIMSLVLAVVGGAFGYGIAVGYYKVWPGHYIREFRNNLESLIKYREFIPDGRRMRAPADAVNERQAILDPDRITKDGYFSLLGWNDEAQSYSVWLYAASGELQHVWPVDELSFSPTATTRSNAPHALRVLPDGSVMVVFDRLGEAYRLDACGSPIWGASDALHHSFAPSADGGYWTWAGNGDVLDEKQYAVRLDVETGAELERIGIAEDMFPKSVEQAVALSVVPAYDFPPAPGEPRDRFHPNDVEELLPEMAAAFPMFEAGDLMLSLRNLNMVLVMDRSGVIKWSRYGPWYQQHDPDFNPDGSITVFDNNPGRGNSRLLRTFPGLGPEQTALVPTPDFFTTYRGKHQMLPNGSVLLTVPEQGQALEIAPDGSVVRQFNNLSTFGEGYHEDLVNAAWLPADYFTQMPSCTAQ